jgi:laminin alpha 3/5
MDMVDWEMVVPIDKNGNFTNLFTYPEDVNVTTVIVSLTTNDTFENIVYFSAPDAYLGKRLTSYGGYFNYSVYYSTGPFGKAVSAADIILQGADTALFYYSDEQPPSSTNFRASVRLVEANFLTSNRLSATREQIMVVLEDLHGIYVRATYWNPSIMASYVFLVILIEYVLV